MLWVTHKACRVMRCGWRELVRVVFVVDVTYQHNWYGLLREMGQGLEPEPLTRK